MRETFNGTVAISTGYVRCPNPMFDPMDFREANISGYFLANWNGY